MIGDFEPRAQRSLKRLEAFENVSENDLLANISEFSETLKHEGVIGRYKNSESFADSIIFSNAAVYFNNASWNRIPYIDIDNLIPDLDIREASIIGLLLHSGEKLEFRITGSDGKYRDQTTVFQFLHRILGDLNKHKEDQ